MKHSILFKSSRAKHARSARAPALRGLAARFAMTGALAFSGLIGLFPLNGLAAQSGNQTPDFRFPAAGDPLLLRSGGAHSFTVDVFIPASNHIYIKHARDISLNILTEFKSASPGWAVAVEKAPAAKRYKDDYILAGRGDQSAGQFTLKLYETLGRAPANTPLTVKVEIKSQMCNSETNICYRPITKTKEIRVRIDKDKTRTVLPKRRGGVDWVQSYDQALSNARSTGRNIFVVITAPDWCGYCKVLEARVFSKSGVANRLNQKFVPLQLLDSNSDRNKFSFDGYPTMLIAGANGKKIAEVRGRDESSFLQAIKGYEKDSTDESSADAAESYSFSIQVKGDFKKTEAGWERHTDGGAIEKFAEHRRSKSYIILKSKATGQFVALPIKGGKGLIYRNSAWEPAFDVAKP
ncbi:MAG: thioredoxin family protein [Leptospirales bacterium]|jgi:thioredoxin-related protein